MKLASRNHSGCETPCAVVPAGTPVCPTPSCARHPKWHRVGHHNFPLATLPAKPNQASPVGPSLPDAIASSMPKSLARRASNFPLAIVESVPTIQAPVGPNFLGQAIPDTHTRRARDLTTQRSR